MLHEEHYINVWRLFPARAAAILGVRLDPGVGDTGDGWLRREQREARLSWLWQHGLERDWRVMAGWQAVGWRRSVDRDGGVVVAVGELVGGRMVVMEGRSLVEAVAGQGEALVELGRLEEVEDGGEEDVSGGRDGGAVVEEEAVVELEEGKEEDTNGDCEEGVEVEEEELVEEEEGEGE